MKHLKIRVYRYGKDAPDTTVTVPGNVLRLASRLIPGRARRALLDEGIDIDELVRLSGRPDVAGTLVEVEDHVENERVAVALE